MTQPSSTAAIEKGTGRSWEEWRAFLEEIDARNLPHKEIAERIFATGRASAWWSQMVTVAWEQAIGRRVPGQSCDGDFSVSVSKTVSGDLAEAFARFSQLMSGRTELSDVAITRGPDTSETEKWRYWRCGLADGSRISISAAQKGVGKTQFSVSHDRIEDQAQTGHWRTFWKDVFTEHSPSTR